MKVSAVIKGCAGICEPLQRGSVLLATGQYAAINSWKFFFPGMELHGAYVYEGEDFTSGKHHWIWGEGVGTLQEERSDLEIPAF